MSTAEEKLSSTLRRGRNQSRGAHIEEKEARAFAENSVEKWYVFFPILENSVSFPPDVPVTPSQVFFALQDRQ